MMYVHWKYLLVCGIIFWALVFAADLLGASTWKKFSPYVADILRDQYQSLVKMHEEEKNEALDNLKVKTNWPMLLWNICAFLCTLLFCSVFKSMSWFLWKLFRIYNVFKNRKVISGRLLEPKVSDGIGEGKLIRESNSGIKSNCQILFKNQMFLKQESTLNKELEELKKEKNEMAEQLMLAKKENMTAKQQIEEYKLETLMMKEKLTRTADSLKENLKYKDFASANQEIIARKAHSLEIHLKEVSRDRDLLKCKLNNLEKSYSKLTDRLMRYEKEKCEKKFSVLMPEKDTSKSSETQERESSESKGDADVGIMQMNSTGLLNGLGNSTKSDFKASSKISVDLEDSSKDNDFECLQDSNTDFKRANIDAIKQNILTYSAYKAQMLKPRFKLTNFKRLYASTDAAGSSSDENASCHRIISSTVEFQNFLKTLNSKSVDSVSLNRNLRC